MEDTGLKAKKLEGVVIAPEFLPMVCESRASEPYQSSDGTWWVDWAFKAAPPWWAGAVADEPHIVGGPG